MAEVESWTLDKLKQEVYLDLMKIRSGQIER